MKVKITKKKVYDPKGKEVPVGTVLNLEGDTIPAFLVNKCEVVEAEAETEVEIDPKAGAKAADAPAKK